MSAYVVDLNHINYLINAALETGDGHQTFRFYHNHKWHEVELDNADKYGQMLLDENTRSVSYRYGNEDNTPEQLPGPVDESPIYSYTWNHYDGFKPAQVFQSIRCLNYQSCEHESWESSAAYAFLQALTLATIGRVPGFDSAEWGAPEPNKSIRRLLA